MICCHPVNGERRGLPRCLVALPPLVPLTEGVLAHPAHCLSWASSFPPVTTPAEASWKDVPRTPAQGRFAPDPSRAAQTSASPTRRTSASMGHGLLYHGDGIEEPGQVSRCLVVIDSCLSSCSPLTARQEFINLFH